MLRFAEIPKWLRIAIKIVYSGWVVAVTVFGAILVLKSLDFDAEIQLSFEILLLLAGIIVAPQILFARRLLFPGGSGIEFDVDDTEDTVRLAERGIQVATVTFDLPNLESLIGEDHDPE